MITNTDHQGKVDQLRWEESTQCFLSSSVWPSISCARRHPSDHRTTVMEKLEEAQTPKKEIGTRNRALSTVKLVPLLPGKITPANWMRKKLWRFLPLFKLLCSSSRLYIHCSLINELNDFISKTKKRLHLWQEAEEAWRDTSSRKGYMGNII